MERLPAAGRLGETRGELTPVAESGHVGLAGHRHPQPHGGQADGAADGGVRPKARPQASAPRMHPEPLGNRPVDDHQRGGEFGSRLDGQEIELRFHNGFERRQNHREVRRLAPRDNRAEGRISNRHLFHAGRHDPQNVAGTLLHGGEHGVDRSARGGDKGKSVARPCLHRGFEGGFRTWRQFTQQRLGHGLVDLPRDGSVVQRARSKEGVRPRAAVHQDGDVVLVLDEGHRRALHRVHSVEHLLPVAPALP